MTWEANASFQMGFWPRHLDLCWCQSLTKNEKILHLRGSLIAIRESKLAMVWKQITDSSHAFFFKLSVLLSFKSHPPHPCFRLVSPLSPLPTLSLIAKCFPSLSTLLNSFQGSVTLSPHPPSCLHDSPSQSLVLSQLHCFSVINHIITPFPSTWQFFFFSQRLA